LSKSWGSRLHTRAVNRLREILEAEETGEGHHRKSGAP